MSHICNLNFSSGHIKKFKETGQMILILFYLPQYIKNIPISPCPPCEVTGEMPLLLPSGISVAGGPLAAQGRTCSHCWGAARGQDRAPEHHTPWGCRLLTPQLPIGTCFPLQKEPICISTWVLTQTHACTHIQAGIWA